MSGCSASDGQSYACGERTPCPSNQIGYGECVPAMNPEDTIGVIVGNCTPGFVVL